MLKRLEAVANAWFALSGVLLKSGKPDMAEVRFIRIAAALFPTLGNLLLAVGGMMLTLSSMKVESLKECR